VGDIDRVRWIIKPKRIIGKIKAKSTWKYITTMKITIVASRFMTFGRFDR
jgi:hypothetical protein